MWQIAAPASRAAELGDLPGCKPVSVPFRAAVIPLDQALLPGSSDLPESPTERAAPPLLFGLAPRGVYPANPDYSGRGALLPHLFTLAPRSNPRGRYVFCGTIRETRFERIPPAVSRHAALWRPDFPPATQALTRVAGDCPPGRPRPYYRSICERKWGTEVHIL
jgi:hypothetical protein